MVDGTFLNSWREIITLVEERNKNIDNTLQLDFFTNNPNNVEDLSDVENLARNKFNLQDPKTGLRSIFPPNYKKG